ncbi:fructose-1,6-bisphosphatase [Candidatus Micrarchaeota archaeon]|nr:fructose-1,6-bisphosphatase [Candidatus Micrarchaeota archaeon]
MERNICNFLIELSSKLKERLDQLHRSGIDPSREISQGAGGDNTTILDKTAEDFLVSEISKKYDCTIISEELGEKEFGKDSDLTFVIDPIDGTKNGKRNLPVHAVSIAVLKSGKPIIGVVRDLYNGEIYTAIEGEGAFLNGEKIEVRKEDELKMVVFGAPQRGRDFEFFVKKAQKAEGIRIFGAAALEICYVAAGKATLFSHIHPEKVCLKTVDYAAADLILREAGGISFDGKIQQITNFTELKTKTDYICASSKELIEKFLQD